MTDLVTPAVAVPEPVAAPRLRSRAAALQARVPVVQIVVLLVVFGWGAAQVPGFASGPSIRATLVIASLLALASFGQTLVVLIGGLDLAVPGHITVDAVAAADLGGSRQHWPLWAAVLLTMGVCAVAGGVCGAICHYFAVQSLVVTPPVGRRLYATGANPRAASGLLIRTGWMWAGVFAVGAVTAGLAGMLIAGFASGATPSVGDPYFYSGLAAVLVGGTALGSARGDFPAKPCWAR
jgi:ribose transport system permease protein